MTRAWSQFNRALDYEEYVLADSGYGMQMYIIPLYRKPQKKLLSNDKRSFNTAVALPETNRKDDESHQLACTRARACTILHNMVHSDVYLDDRVLLRIQFKEIIGIINAFFVTATGKSLCYIIAVAVLSIITAIITAAAQAHQILASSRRLANTVEVWWEVIKCIVDVICMWTVSDVHALAFNSIELINFSISVTTVIAHDTPFKSLFSSTSGSKF
ncbi:hypothetical protein BJ742DRAFT_737434 [Cladochytrium replicatum]|nr:hypothetical protein BJ742DRAFT_737434 [Cladochytrium replicatum]